MRTAIWALVVAVTFSGPAVESRESEAARIVATYLKMPHPEGDRPDETRLERLETLSALSAMPDEAVDAIAQVMPQVSDPRQRAELAGALGQYIQTGESAALLCELLQDPDAQVRAQAIHGLRMLARRTNRMGAQRRDREGIIEPKDERTTPLPEFAPKVEGLVPFLVAAADDEVEINRICALYALADSRDPAAVLELRRRLKDPSEKVRFYAACFLTEHQDASGLTEMQIAMARLRQTDSDDDIDYYFQVETLLASFERITGKSFGRIPLNPFLSSNTEQIPELEKTYATLLATWAQWWAWEPPEDRRPSPAIPRSVLTPM